MYIDRSDWKRHSLDMEGTWNYRDQFFRCQIADNGSDNNFSWYVDATHPHEKYPRREASGHNLPTFEAAEAAVDAIINFLLNGELGDYVKRMARMPKCPHCGAQDGYSARGVKAKLETTQDDVELNFTLSGTHITKIPEIALNDFKVVEIIGTPKTVWCNSCKKDITDENFLAAIPFVRKNG